MSTIWIWRVVEYDAGAPTNDPLIGVDPTGYDVEAKDGRIGKVDEATNEAGRGFLVVDTGFWIFGKKRMIPTSTVERVDPDEHNIYLALTKDQVKEAPDYDEVRRDEESHRSDVEDHYDRTRTASPSGRD